MIVAERARLSLNLCTNLRDLGTFGLSCCFLCVFVCTVSLNERPDTDFLILASESSASELVLINISLTVPDTALLRMEHYNLKSKSLRRG